MRRLVLLLAAAFALWGAPGAFAAGWCGDGESSADRFDTTTGRQIHAIWAVPSDSADTFATGAQKIAADLDSINAWWAVQDPTRVPRVDTAAFPAGTCADISFVRLASPAAFYTGASAAFGRLSFELAADGFGNVYKKYLVYFDGPSVQTNVCGTGDGQFDSGPSFAVVWLAGCPSVPTDSVAAHELLHALGALPDGAPHACPGDSGHPCDSPQDVLYPYNSGAPLQSLYLDFNHDDYYAHSGTWIDIQDSAWLHLLGVPMFPLSIAFAGIGTVTSDVPGVDCQATCATQWERGSTVELTAVGASSTRFVGWRGACTGALACKVIVGAPVAVTAAFGPLRVPVSIRETGRGNVRCTPRCGAKTLAAGTRLVLRAVPAKGWRFVRWSGDCAASHTTTCRPKTDYHVTAGATFRRR